MLRDGWPLGWTQRVLYTIVEWKYKKKIEEENLLKSFMGFRKIPQKTDKTDSTGRGAGGWDAIVLASRWDRVAYIYTYIVIHMYVYHISAGWAKQRAKRCAGNMLTKIAHKMRRDFGDFVRDNARTIRESMRESERERGRLTPHGWAFK